MSSKKSKRLRWADQDCSDLNGNENCSTTLPRPLFTKTVCSPSPSKILATESHRVCHQTSRIPRLSSGLKYKKTLSDQNNAVSNEKQTCCGPSRLAVKKTEPSPGPLRILVSQASKSHPPLRVQMQSPCLIGKQVLTTGVKGKKEETPLYRSKIPSGSSIAPSRVRVENAPSPAPRRVPATPSFKTLNQTPVRVPIQRSSFSMKKIVLYTDIKDANGSEARNL